jgi:hypothetical protein
LATPLPGLTVRISGTAPFHVEKIVADFSKAPWKTTGCTGGTGIALGPDKQLANSCGLIINFETGAVIANFESEGGADEIWHNPSDNHYSFGDTTALHLGVVDAGPPPSADLTAVTGPGSHSVAADSVTNEVYVPIRGNNGTVPPSTGAAAGAVCSKANDVFGLAASDALGCILTYIAPSDSDDAPPAGKPGAEEGAVHRHEITEAGANTKSSPSSSFVPPPQTASTAGSRPRLSRGSREVQAIRAEADGGTARRIALVIGGYRRLQMPLLRRR